MTIGQALFLGLVQGVTEFLPVSSSGHLVIFQELLGINQGALTFNVMVHVATLLAILFYFRRKIISLSRQQFLMIVVASLPVAVVGFLFKDVLEQLFISTRAVGVALLITAGLNFYIDRNLKKTAETEKNKSNTPRRKQALIVGLFQAAAVIPGISRSGSTVAGGISQKFSRSDAFSFSFLIGVPAIMGAAGLQVLDLVNTPGATTNTALIMIGGIAAFLSGLLSLRLFEYVISRARMELFGWYCLGMGLLTLFFL